MKNRLYLCLAMIVMSLVTITSWADAKEFIFNLGYGKIQVIDVSTDAIVTDIPIKGWCREAVFTADKKFMYVTASRHMIHKIDLQTMRSVKTIDLHSGGWQRFIYGIGLAEDGQTAYIHFVSRKTDKGDVVVAAPAVAQIDLDSGKILRSVDVPFGVINLAYSPNKRMVYAVGQDVYKIDVSQKELKLVETYPLFDREMNILPIFSYTAENGGIFLAPYYTPKLAGLLSIDINKCEIKEAPLKMPIMAYGAVLSPDGKKAYANMDELYVIDLATSAVTNTEVIHEGTTFGVMVSADGKKIYLQGGPKITIYDAETLRVQKVLHLSTDGIMINRVVL